MKWLLILLPLVTILAVFPMPYEYYMGLRVFVFAGAGFILFDVYKSSGLNSNAYWLIVVIILYNPVIKVSLNKELWVLINIVTCIFFLSLYKSLRDKERGIAPNSKK